MLYVKNSGGVTALSESFLAALPKDVLAKNVERGVYLDEENSEVIKHLETQQEQTAKEDKLRKIRRSGITKLAKSAGLDDAEVKAVFGEVGFWVRI